MSPLVTGAAKSILQYASYRSISQGSSASSDPYYNNVVLLLKGDGTNGSTNIVDSSINPKTITVVGNSQISTTQSKFGGSSLSFVRSPSSYLTISNSSGDFSFGTGDFTVECWVYLNTMPAGDGYPNAYWIMGGGPQNSNTGFDVSIGQGFLRIGIDTYFTYNEGHGMTNNIWYHVAACRKSDRLYGFIDGNLLFPNTVYDVAGKVADPMTGGVAISAAEPVGATSGNFNGYIDDLRVTKGVGRYNANFTPPGAL